MLAGSLEREVEGGTREKGGRKMIKIILKGESLHSHKTKLIMPKLKF